jgi:glycosyltransferase involved in cell wall biosynthesis
MKILHICPLWFPIAPDAPGGIETFLAHLVTQLEALGCQSTLLASGDSRCAGELVPVVPVALREAMAARQIAEYVYYEQGQLLEAIERASGYDLIHSHVGPGAYVLSAVAPRVLHTQHSPVYDDLVWFAAHHPRIWFSTVSQFQARKLGRTSRCEAIHNGIDVSSYTFSADAVDGLVFLGRIEHAKGPDLAIDVANALGLPLTLAGPVVEPHFFAERIRPRLGPAVRYVGVVNHQEKNSLLSRSRCAVLPFRGEEAFGLVMVEAMACGTPVVSLTNGAVSEVVDSGVTGYLATDERNLADAVRRAMVLDRHKIRDVATARFHIPMVAEKYCRLYDRIIAEPPS